MNRIKYNANLHAALYIRPARADVIGDTVVGRNTLPSLRRGVFVTSAVQPEMLRRRRLGDFVSIHTYSAVSQLSDEPRMKSDGRRTRCRRRDKLQAFVECHAINRWQTTIPSTSAAYKYIQSGSNWSTVHQAVVRSYCTYTSRPEMNAYSQNSATLFHDVDRRSMQQRLAIDITHAQCCRQSTTSSTITPIINIHPKHPKPHQCHTLSLSLFLIHILLISLISQSVTQSVSNSFTPTMHTNKQNALQINLHHFTTHQSVPIDQFLTKILPKPLPQPHPPLN
jgi:hypothetical protein